MAPSRTTRLPLATLIRKFLSLSLSLSTLVPIKDPTNHILTPSFLRWRVGLMEKSVQALNLAAATQPIPDFGQGPDPYQGFQVHDYLQVSFLRRDPLVKTATSKTIEVLGKHYPETLSRKFFVNVPTVMGWVYTAVKLVVAKETAKKFTVLSSGNQLAAELGKGVPKEYGGDKGELQEVGEAVKFVD